MRDRLDSLLDEAGRRDLSIRDALDLLCEAEVRHREERRIQMGLGIAKFPFVRTLDGFEFDAQPSLDPKQIRDLATCRWIANGDALLLLGPPGVGKTHLAVALGREAVRLGFTVLFASATGLLTTLAKAHVEGRLEDRPRGLELRTGSRPRPHDVSIARPVPAAVASEREALAGLVERVTFHSPRPASACCGSRSAGSGNW